MNSKPISIWNPANENFITEIPSHSPEEVSETIQRAQKAQKIWAKLPIAKRQDFLYQIGEMVLKHRDELAELESMDVGKPISAAKGEAEGVAACFKYYAGAIDKVHGDTIDLDTGISFTFNEPIGVVGVITPWNFPLPIASWNIAPALAAGNSVIVKPASLTPLSTRRLAELVAEISPVENLLQVITGAGSTTGAALIDDPRVGKISFTGSTEVGKSILRSSADSMKRVTLELGGKSANLVFADADVSAAAAAAPGAVYDNTGQDCCARSRILVQRSALDEFVQGFISATEKMKIGNPADEDTVLGPLVSADHHATVSSFLDPQQNFLYRGETPDGPGHWMAPQLILDVKGTSRAAVDEIFGPVAVIIPFDTEDEAVELANNSIYGLSGSVWTNDVAKALRVSRQIESGTLSVNSNSSIRVQAPFGGFKQSGMGRELGIEGLLGYTELKTVFIPTQ